MLRLCSFSPLNCRFILSFLCIYLRSYFIPFLFHGNFRFFSFWKFFTLVPFFVSFLWNISFNFFSHTATKIPRQYHDRFGNFLGNIHNCNFRPKKEPSVPISLRLSLRIEHSCPTLYLHFWLTSSVLSDLMRTRNGLWGWRELYVPLA